MPIYETYNYEMVIERIREKVAALDIKMGECLSEDQITAYETRHNVKLPPAYRVFLKCVGNGCDYMLDGCRLNDLESCPCKKLSQPFMLENFWIWEDDEREQDIIKAIMNERVYQGNIELINLGDGMSYNLIMTGKCRGEVWNFTDVGVQPCSERQDFLGWFELWLDNQDETDYFKDYVYDEADYE